MHRAAADVTSAMRPPLASIIAASSRRCRAARTEQRSPSSSRYTRFFVFGAATMRVSSASITLRRSARRIALKFESDCSSGDVFTDAASAIRSALILSTL